MVSYILFSVWKYMGYYMVIYLAGLQGISGEMYEAASLDGADSFQKFRYITVPMLTPTTFFVLIMLTIQCFKVFDLVYVMTGGGPVNSTHMLSTYSYKLSFEMFKYSKGAAVANVLLVILLVVGVFYLRATKEEEDNG